MTIHSQRPLIEVHADKLIMNVEASIANTGSTAFEVLQRAPGVTVDQNDNIALKGKQGVTIMIDGKILPVGGEDLANMLKGMPSGSIDQIEALLIREPGTMRPAPQALSTSGLRRISVLG